MTIPIQFQKLKIGDGICGNEYDCQEGSEAPLKQPIFLHWPTALLNSNEYARTPQTLARSTGLSLEIVPKLPLHTAEPMAAAKPPAVLIMTDF